MMAEDTIETRQIKFKCAVCFLNMIEDFRKYDNNTKCFRILKAV